MPIPGMHQESVTVVTRDGAVRRFSTTYPPDARYMMKRGLTPAAIHKDKDGEEVAWDFTLPDDWAYLPRPRKKMSEESRAKAAERMRNRMNGNEGDEEAEE